MVGEKMLSTYTKLKSFFKEHYYILILLVISLVFFNQLLSPSKILDNVHYVNDLTFQSEHYRQFFHEGKGFPLWTPYFYSGQPYMAIPEYYLFDLNFLLIWLTNNIYVSMNIAVIFYFFLAGLGMYLLVDLILKNRHAAFIAALIYLFNDFMQSFILSGHLNMLESFAYMPFIFLFVHKAIHDEQYWVYAVLAATFASLMILAGGIIFFLYTFLLIGLYLAFSFIFSKEYGKDLLRYAIIGALLLVVTFAFAAIKLLPSIEFVNISSRAATVSFEEFLGEPISVTNVLGTFLLTKKLGFSVAIGVLGFLLLIVGMLSFRKKIILFSFLVIVLAILIGMGSFLAQWMYHLPGFKQMRHVERALVLFAFVAPIVCAQGFMTVSNFIKEKISLIRKEQIIAGTVIVAIIVELVLFRTFPLGSEVVSAQNIEIVQALKNDESKFRIANLALSTPIGAAGYNYYAQDGLESIKGGGGIWMNDYIAYLLIAEQTLPAKLYGILNGKYVVSSSQLDDPSLIPKGSFKVCETCRIQETYGPYLYENTLALPRAYLVDKSLLLVGNDAYKNQFMYEVLVRLLNPSSAVVIEGKERIAEYSDEELSKFSAIALLPGSVAQQDGLKLQSYVNKGGILIPDVTKDESTVSVDALNAVLNGNTTQVNEVVIQYPTFGEASIDTNNQKGWLVLSERYAYIPGWKDVQNPDNTIYPANKVISALWLSGNQKQMQLAYTPESVRNGLFISLFSIVIVISGFVIYWVRKNNAKIRT